MMHLKQLGNQSFAFLLLSGLGSVRDRTRKLIRADGGAAAVFFALTSPIWLGGVALAAEVGSWYYLQQKIQGTADSVALGTARRIPSGASRDELIYESGQQVELELIPGSTLSNLQISSSGANWVDGTTVEATVSLSRPLLLSKLFMDGDNIEIAAHSTAEVSRAAPGCVLSLQKAMQGGVSVNAANIRLTGCDVISNSVQNFNSFVVNAGSTLTANCVRTAGLFSIDGILNLSCNSGSVEQAGYALDPYPNSQDLNLSAYPCTRTGESEAVTWNFEGGTFPVPQTAIDGSGQRYVRFCDHADLIVDRNWGELQGDLTGDMLLIFDNAELRFGSNASTFRYSGGTMQFYFTNSGRPNFTKAISLTFTAPPVGPRAGILFYGTRTNIANAIFIAKSANAWDSIMNGAIYMPGSRVDFQGTGTFGGCTQIIGDSVVLSGAWTSNGPCIGGGTNPIIGATTVRLLN